MLLDGYIRVSQVGVRHGERFISPEIQRDQILGWMSLNGALPGEIFHELDESGARKDRPLLMKAIARVESGTSGGIVVAKLDRFGRSLTDGLAAIDRIQAAGGTFVSVQDGLDLNTPTGKLVLRIMFSMAEWELDRIRTNWETARIKAIRRGVHVGSWPPFGYVRRADGRLKPHPRNSGIATELFNRRAGGAPIRALGRWLESEGVPTTRGNRGWSEQSLRHIIRNRVYLGEVRLGIHVQTDAHPPLVDELVWQRAQSPRVLPPPGPRSPTLLGGLLRCAGCSMVLHSQNICRAEGHLASAYACHGRSGAGDCPSAAYAAGGLIEPLVERAFFSRLRRKAPLPARSQRTLRELERRRRAAEEALGTYRDNPRLPVVLGNTDFEEGLRVRVSARDLAVKRLDAERRRIAPRLEKSVDEMEGRWPEMSIVERREAIADVIDCVFVWRGRRNIRGRTHICYRGQAPPDLPSRGVRRSRFRTIRRQELPPAPKLKKPSAWPKRRIKGELEAFLAPYGTWPPSFAFYREGRGPLYERVVRTGGPGYWARQLGFKPPRGNSGLTEWAPDDARAALSGFVGGRTVFPSRREFIAAGQSSLFGWLLRNGGLDFWATEFGLPRPSPGPRPGDGAGRQGSSRSSPSRSSGSGARSRASASARDSRRQ
jgi:DNA invertase Pin-like site-specific DNA recombinase